MEASKSKGLQLNRRDFQGRLLSGLHEACRFGRANVVKYLLENAEKYGIDANNLDFRRNTILHTAILTTEAPIEEKCEVVKIILEFADMVGLDINHRNMEGKPPRYYVDKYRHYHCMNVLFEQVNK